ncbi:hypothetical protein ASPZODRAFT_134461 [Penicilliopsis zonata CBS 506.65]|uniref:Uncharacterized protein n=1 Tax=Penicilliopsis zonata CBS 506.65 TaxID=1073090 RepID=A0A1L9SD11_9EURO|nr:hypothetical protein ASPZODRAFT_134461 [Penicilliopsis zonata CBS 506.65]OJJ45028.1 hypothetical protein ASPZODRAFT_134461 [Penicilliopsis zonata CBS 506.65]
MNSYTCADHGDYFWSAAEILEHLRDHHASFIGQPGLPGVMDSHGHIWYCFECESHSTKHRGFDSDQAMLDHLKQRHGNIMSSVYIN